MGMSETMDDTSTTSTDTAPFQGNSSDVYVQQDVDAITSILDKAATSHHEYETTFLNGIFDKDWPSYYAISAVRNGIGQFINNQLNGPDGLPTFNLTKFLEKLPTNPPEIPWSRFAALELVKKYGRPHQLNLAF